MHSILAFTILSITSVLSIISIRNIFLGIASNSWHPATATIEDIKILPKKNADNDVLFTPKIAYRFKTKSGLWVKAKRFTYRTLSSLDYSTALGYINRIRVGAECKIYYNPKRPKQAVVLRGVNMFNFLESTIYFGFMFLTINNIYGHYWDAAL